MFRSFALSPYIVRNEPSLEKIKSLQPIWNKLFNAVARDKDWLTNVFSPLSSECAWTKHEIEVYRKCHEYLQRKPTLLLSNSIHLSPQDGPEDFKLSVTNVQAGEPFQVQLARDFQQYSHQNGLQSGPLWVHTETLAKAAKLVHSSNSCVAILTKPSNGLAMRTKADAMGIASRLMNVDGVACVLHVSMQDLARSSIDQQGDLVLDGQKISVVYSRYDFSHPSGKFKTNPSKSDRESPEAWKDEWDTIERIERSNAIMSSSIGSRLAVRRWTQYALSRPGELERFLPGPEASLVRQVIPEQWALIGLGEEEKYTVQEARELFEMNPEEFVAKNILRPRTGSGKTQDRMDSGGMIVDSADAIRRLLTIESDGRPKGRNYILYRKIHGRRHDAVLAHESDLHRLDHGLAVSEVATYGAYLSLAGQENSAIIVNCLAGLGARTRVCSRDHPIAQVLGYGAVSGVCLAA